MELLEQHVRILSNLKLVAMPDFVPTLPPVLARASRDPRGIAVLILPHHSPMCTSVVCEAHLGRKLIDGASYTLGVGMFASPGDLRTIMTRQSCRFSYPSSLDSRTTTVGPSPRTMIKTSRRDSMTSLDLKVLSPSSTPLPIWGLLNPRRAPVALAAGSLAYTLLKSARDQATDDSLATSIIWDASKEHGTPSISRSAC